MVSDVSKISDVNAYFIIFMYFTIMESWTNTPVQKHAVWCLFFLHKSYILVWKKVLFAIIIVHINILVKTSSVLKHVKNMQAAC